MTDTETEGDVVGELEPYYVSGFGYLCSREKRGEMSGGLMSGQESLDVILAQATELRTLRDERPLLLEEGREARQAFSDLMNSTDMKIADLRADKARLLGAVRSIITQPPTNWVVHQFGEPVGPVLAQRAIDNRVRVFLARPPTLSAARVSDSDDAAADSTARDGEGKQGCDAEMPWPFLGNFCGIGGYRCKKCGPRAARPTETATDEWAGDREPDPAKIRRLRREPTTDGTEGE